MKQILIVDDELQIRELYSKLLTNEDYKIFQAASAGAAHDVLLKENIDLILLDINMPEINGILMNRYMLSFHKREKVIVTSVYLVNEQKLLIQGAADYYNKSQGVEVLLEKIWKALAAGPQDITCGGDH